MMKSRFLPVGLGLATALLGGCSNGRTPVAPVSPPQTAKVTSSEFGSDLGYGLLKDTARLAERVGAADLQLVSTGVRHVGESLEGFILLPANRCALVYGRAGDTVVDLDLHAFGDDGTQYGADEAPDDLPTLMLCGGDRALRLFLSARVAQGHGLISIGLHDVPLRAKEEVARVVGARETKGKTELNSQIWPSLEQDLTAHLTAVGGRWQELRRVALPVDARIPTRMDAEIPADRCLNLFAVPEDAYLQVDMTLFERDERIAARGIEIDAERYAVVCSRRIKRRVHLDLRPQVGQGLVFVAVSVSTDQAVEADLSENVVPVILGGAPPSLASNRGPTVFRNEQPLEVGQLYGFSATSRGCLTYSVDKLGQEEGPARATIRVYGEGGLLVGERPDSTPHPLTVCSEGPTRFEVEPTAHMDRGLVQVVREPAHQLLPQLSPFSTARALLRARYLLSEEQVLSPLAGKEMALTEEQLTTELLTLPPKSCTTLVGGTATSTGSLEIRLQNRESGVLLAHASGHKSAGLSYCTGEDEIDASVEFRREGPPTRGSWLLYQKAR